MSVEFDIASDQIDGARDYQEDAFMVSQMGNDDAGNACSLVIMADGMGGHAAGNVASNMVIATFNKSFQSDFPSSNVPQSLTSALTRANQQIADSIKETPALRGMGCTMVSGYLEGDKLYWVSVGDSHLYLLRDRELIKQNADHSYGAYLDMMNEQGVEIEEQPGMSRNMLMSAMTGEEISSIDCPDEPITVKPGDRLIIASDGLDTLGEGAIVQYSSWSSTARECVYALLKAVEEANKINQDNTTIIVVDIKKRAEAAASAPASKLETQTEKPALNFDTQAQTSRNIYEEETGGKFKILIWIILLLVIGGGGFYAWQQGLIDQLIPEQGVKMPDLLTKPAPAPVPPVKAPDTAPEPVPKQAEPAQPVVPAPTAQPEALVQDKYVDKYDPFTDNLKIGGRGPVMIQVPAGTFRMGDMSGLISADEAPRHERTISTFAMSVNEVTYADYDKFAQATGRRKPSSNGLDRKSHPVSDVSWDDALAYVNWLSKQTGKKYRLPSEAEWEYAARGGTRTSFWWGTQKGSGNAHCFDCGTDLNINQPAKVGSFKPNPFGLNDTAGNLFEWVHDCYHRNYVDAPSDGSVWEGGDCSVRVARGGAFRSPASSMRVENRETFASDKGHYNVGIRVVREM